MTKDNEDALWCAECLNVAGHYDSERHIRRLVQENEAKDALLRQAVEAWDDEQSMRSTIAAIRQHLEGRA